MPTIKVLPNAELCPDGTSLDVESGISICDALLQNDVMIEHACEKSCACTTCHVIVRGGVCSLAEASEEEEDLLDKAWGLDAHSRLSCQAVVSGADLTIFIPRYTINHAKEGSG